MAPSPGKERQRMSGCGCTETKFDGVSPAYRRALIAVIAVNAGMFLVEITAGALGRR